MARQFREQLEEEVQLEEARKAQRAAAPAAPEAARPAEAPSATEASSPAEAPPAAETPPHAAGNGGPRDVIPETFSHAHPTDATGADPTAVRPAQSPGADERRT